MRATRAIIHLDNFHNNVMIVQKHIGPEKLICVPVKADAYGHGSTAIARKSLEAAASYLAVATVQEGADLRKEGISTPILLFSQIMPDEIPELINNKIIPFVSDLEFITILDKAASEAKIRLPVHLKIDTGMNRMGCTPGEAPFLAKKIAGSNALEYAGTATHFAVSDSTNPDDIFYTEKQISIFNEVIANIKAAGLNPGIISAANSGAVIQYPKAWFDMVRPGILLYGYNTVKNTNLLKANPSPFSEIKPVMELRTNIAVIRQVKKGETVSYGRTWISPQNTVIAVLPVGYGDGLPRLASNKWQVFINKTEYPLIGRICMDQCMVNLGPVLKVNRWDEAVLFGGPAPGADILAERTGTIPYEITCNINKRVPRVYVQ